MPSSFTKTPAESLPYGIDWSAWLAGDTIVTSAWAVPADLTGSNQNIGLGATATSIKLAGGKVGGGAAGVGYQITNTITTAAGLTGERQITLRVVTSR
jgi:hypothetical protein